MGQRLGSFVVIVASAVACLPTRTQRVIPAEDDGGTPPITVDGGTGSPDADAPPTAPHALLGVDPPHGPFSGGTLAKVRGNGFRSDARVWFGGEELAPSDIIVLDPRRLQVTTPPGVPGPADVVVQNGDDESTRVLLRGGFSYDDLYVEPSSGPTVGGTVITVHSHAALFDENTSVRIDGEPCEIEAVKSARELTCRTPPGTPGTKLVRATVGEDGDEQSLDVLDAFTYVVSDDGFRGGLSGDPLDGTLEVLVLDDATGTAISGATVIAGTDVENAPIARTDRFGMALLRDETLDGPVTVTIARSCFQPITFVDVPVERMTVYLDPVLSPACGDTGELPSGGGNPGRSSSVSGEIVWPLDGELREAGWENIPTPPREDVHKVGYVFRLAQRPTDTFSLPSAVSAITPGNEGELGYTFALTTSPGNFTLYALVGLEDRSRSPYVFTPYAMGLTRGVAGAAGQSRSDIFIQIDTALDHALSIDASGPKATARGPDRIHASVAIEVGNEGYVLLPGGKQSRLLPTESPFRFVGVPALAGQLTGARYVATASAVTGEAGSPPLSSVGLFATVTANEPLGVGAFLELPLLTSPESSQPWNGREFGLDREAGGPRPDLTLIDVSSGAGLVSWRIVAPGAPSSVRVPELAALDEELGVIPGPIAVRLTVATVDDFDYASLKTQSLSTRGFRAYAQDVFFASY